MTATPASYPVQVSVADAAPQNRLTVFFRFFLLIPHAIVLSLIGIAAIVVYIVAWFAILISGRYPLGMYRFTVGFFRWNARFYGYAYLLTDRYPSFSFGEDAEYPVELHVDERINDRNRLTTFWPIRWILAIPHYIILSVLGYAAAVVVFIGWFAALFTGSVPAGLHNFAAGYVRWYGRAYAYVFLLTDEYPPFSLS